MIKNCILILLLVSNLGYSQNDEKKVNDLIDQFSEELKRDNINTFFYTKHYCIGQSVLFQNDDGSMCFSSGTYYEVYFFWKNEEYIMMKKLDNCGRFTDIQLIDELVYETFIENIKQLREEEVKSYTVENPENVPVQRSKVFPCFREFNFIKGDISFHKKYNLFDLTNESKYKNIYYKHNNSLRLVDLDKIIESLIMELKSKFKREKN
jgi:hypothetical protein